jgi:Mg2+ and Co2+ transporter CorA
MSADDSNTRFCQILIGLEDDIRKFRQNLEAYTRRTTMSRGIGKISEKSIVMNTKIESLTRELCSFFPEAKIIATIEASDANKLKKMATKIVTLRDSLEGSKKIG